ncbi:c-di-GMP-binding flagellar brake protein YcgR [Alicyclobacillus sacchari]|uniref:C-di-GMP-binding flagellar brake protein YcgR n=1 Tax=Alicyclobacillus sacchari TaxID=392010 RepID=A0A4R8LTC2_9BACL|nr:PilZ domain-containing protein [Alicyclobacillus sacchari]TDY50758.1 c-di-GMP-binding flagellar brake protein YcgR [Alicyclobacillus sacchari]GMA55759.1 flagellar protein [Alicyclobacillus sacchari]
MAISPSIGGSVRIRVNNQDSKYYKSRVADVDEQCLYVDVPVDPVTGKEFEIHVDESVVVEYTVSETEVYRYTAHIQGLSYIPTPAIRVEHPAHATDLERIQRREFFRISLDVPVTVMCERMSKEFILQSIDISGGGIAVMTKSAIDIRMNDVVRISLILPYIDYNLKTSCQVVRVQTEANGITTLSMRFVDISERERDQVIRYTFMRQRALRR